MSVNFKKEGFSVGDVAQMFHCNPVTIRKYIDDGVLGAHVEPKEVTPGKKRRIRIMPEHIREFAAEHRSRFDDAFLKKFGITDIPENQVLESISLHAVGEGMCGKTETTVDPNCRVSDSAVITVGRRSDRCKRCKIIIDGRIMVANISKRSALMVVDVLLNDPHIVFADICIEVS